MITVAIGFPIGFILISNYGVMGLIITTLANYIPGIIISLIYIKKRYNVSLQWESSAKILLSSVASAALTYILISQFNFLSSLIQLIIGAVIFAIAYLLGIVLTRTFNSADINNLREMFTALGPFAVCSTPFSTLSKN